MRNDEDINNLIENFKNIEAVIEKFRSRDDKYYDCLYHVDGSTENLYQLYILTKILKLHPLAITFNHYQYSEKEYEMLWKSLEVFDVDHIIFNPRKSVIDKLQKKSKENETLPEYSKVGVLAFTLKISSLYNLPFIVLNKRYLPEDKMFFDLGGCAFDKKKYDLILNENNIKKYLGDSITQYDLNPYLMTDFTSLDNKTAILCFEEKIKISKSEQEKFLLSSFDWAGIYISGTNFVPKKERLKILQEESSLKMEREETKYEKIAKESPEGKPLFHGKLKYCARCLYPETAEALEFDEMGICQPCRSSEQKMHINWIERQRRLKEIFEQYREKFKDYYNCMVPISGGKDSTYQLYMLTHVYGMHPLAVTFSHNWYSKTGKHNLENAVNVFDVDHIMFSPRRSVVNKLAKKSLYLTGDSCWHCHAGVGSFPLHVAVKYKIPLIVWGESASENHGITTYANPIPFSREHFIKISARLYAEEMIGDDITYLDVVSYILPSQEEYDKLGTVGIYIGDYYFWDDERHTEFVRDNFGFMEDRVEGTYKRYKSVECNMAGVHDYTKFIKRGFGRGTDHASADVRAGLLTREEGFELAKIFDTERPDILDYYLKITGLTEEEFEKALKNRRYGKATELP